MSRILYINFACSSFQCSFLIRFITFMTGFTGLFFFIRWVGFVDRWLRQLPHFKSQFTGSNKNESIFNLKLWKDHQLGCCVCEICRCIFRRHLNWTFQKVDAILKFNYALKFFFRKFLLCFLLTVFILQHLRAMILNGWNIPTGCVSINSRGSKSPLPHGTISLSSPRSQIQGAFPHISSWMSCQKGMLCW